MADTDPAATLEAVAGRLTPDSAITVDRPKGLVFVDGDQVADFGAPERMGCGPMEDYADTLWTCVEDLKAALAGWPL